jgi:hypothetical protein
MEGGRNGLEGIWEGRLGSTAGMGENWEGDLIWDASVYEGLDENLSWEWLKKYSRVKLEERNYIQNGEQTEMGVKLSCK